MHPSILGREGPLPCGSSKQLARAPSPRDRTLPPRLTNPAQRLQCHGTRCCAHTPHSPGRFRLPSKSWSISGILGRPCLNMSPKIRRQHHDPASTSAAHGCKPITFHSLPRCAFFSTTPFPLPQFQWLFALLHQLFIVALLTQTGFSLHRLSHQQMAPRGSSRALGTKPIPLLLPR